MKLPITITAIILSVFLAACASQKAPTDSYRYDEESPYFNMGFEDPFHPW